MVRSEEHTSELQSRQYLVCRLLLEKKKKKKKKKLTTTRSSKSHTLMAFYRTLRSADFSVTPLRARLRFVACFFCVFFFFFNDTATTEIYPLPLHDALPICKWRRWRPRFQRLLFWCPFCPMFRFQNRIHDFPCLRQSPEAIICAQCAAPLE